MKFGVKAGESFEVNEAQVIVEVTVNISNPDEKPDQDISIKKAVVVTLIAAAVISLFASIAYGVATGDYSYLKASAEAGESLVNVVVKAGMAAKE